MSGVSVPELAWVRSSRCDSGHCVEVAIADAVFVRDAKHRDAGRLAFDPAAWRAFLASLRP